jgi:hypothetical protein
MTMAAPDDVQWPPHITIDDGPALLELAALDWGEGDDGASHEVPADLLELYEVLEWQRAVEEADQ